MSAPSVSVPSQQSPAEEVKQINEEYKIWKRNCPFLYDLVMTHALEWPSLTVQWLPDKVTPSADSDYSIQRLLLGTHTSDGEPNYLMVVEMRMPLPETDIEAGLYQSAHDAAADGKEYGGYGGTFGRVEIVQQLNLPCELNRVRYMPQKPEIVACKAAQNEVLVFDRSRHPAKPLKHAVPQPEYKLVGHSKEGYGLAWSPHQEGLIISGSEDKLICLWDLNASTLSNSSRAQGQSISSTTTFKGHKDIVEDVAWSPFKPHFFASAADDHTVLFWDTRKSASPSDKLEAHTGEVNCLAFNPESEHLFVSGSADRTIGLWDLRNCSQKLHSFEGHQDQIFTVAWSPHNTTVLASCSADRRVNVWDMTRIGEEQDPEDAEDGPPELLFIHGGHTDKVSDLSWNPHEEWVLASVAEDNVLQVWQMASNIYDREEQEDKEKKVDDSLLE